MSIEPGDFLSSAMPDAKSTGEIVTRNSISRAYYAAYHRALGAFPKDRNFVSDPPQGVHETYIDQLMQGEAGSTMRMVAVSLKAMKGRRHAADYKLGIEIRPAEAAMQINKANEVFSLLNEVEEPAENPNDLQQSNCCKHESPPEPESAHEEKQPKRSFLQRIK